MKEIETEHRYEATFGAETVLVPTVLRRTTSFAMRLGARRVDELMIVVRELIENAIVHGCRSDSSKNVRLSIVHEAGRFVVEVDDEGEGFDFTALDLRIPDYPFALSRRGLVIVHELSEGLIFSGRGNRVRAFVHADEDPVHGESDYGVAAAVDQKYQEVACTSQMVRN